MPKILLAIALAIAVVIPTATVTAKPAAEPTPATLAVIGDTPYGPQQVATFPNDVSAINADPAVTRVMHLGDIKNGSTACSDSYFGQIRGFFDGFSDPLVYTPGDNEWTDCHRANNGSYDPLERLATLRSTFFPVTGQTLGQEVAIESQGAPVVENVTWSQGGAQFGTLHIVGSDNSLAPWTGNSEPTAAQLAEFAQREDANLKWINRIFALAHKTNAAGVVVGMQADMWDLQTSPGFDAIVKRLAQRAHAFGKPVLLLQGDSHHWKVDRPFTPGDSQYGRYVTPVDAPNVTRVVVQGSTSCPHTYLRLKVDASTSKVFTGENVVLPLSPACDSTTPVPGSF